MPLISEHEPRSVGSPCATSLAWTSALVGGVTIRDDDLAPSMVLFFVLLIFLIVGLLRTYAGRSLPHILLVFTPTVLFVLCLTIFSAIRAHLSNTSHLSSFDIISKQSSLLELVAANGLVSCSPMLLCETSFQVFGLLAKRIAERGRRWVLYMSYVARLANLMALVMGVVAACDFASYLTAWLDQIKLGALAAGDDHEACSTSVVGRDLTLLPLTADALLLVVLFVLIVLTLILRLRYRLAAGVSFHVIAILSCLTFHFAWKCVRDWSAVQIYLAGGWTHSTTPIDGKLEDFAKRLRKQAEEPTLFYLLGTVPLVLAMILIYTLDLVSYTHPPLTPAVLRNDFASRFRLFLDPASPRIELLPTSNAPASAGKGGNDGKKEVGGKGKAEGGEGSKTGEMYVVKRGWFGGWSVQPAKEGEDWTTKVTRRARQGVQNWVMGWSADGRGAAAV